jgi:hypothetical protein
MTYLLEIVVKLPHKVTHDRKDTPHMDSILGTRLQKHVHHMRILE